MSYQAESCELRLFLLCFNAYFNFVDTFSGSAKASDAELAEAARTANPEEINIDDEDEDSGEEVDGE